MADEHALKDGVEVVSPPAAEQLPGSSENRRILVIDDNPSIHEDIRKILGMRSRSQLAACEAGLFGSSAPPRSEVIFQVDSAFQGMEGCALARSKRADGAPYALAFVDLRMPPGFDGIETIERLWNDDPELQIVICSAYSDHSWSDIMQRLRPADGLLILRKPFDVTEIRQIAFSLTTKWHLTRTTVRQIESLEARVAERTRELVAANERLREESEERARIEAELRLAHKLEAVGQLAAGIAHELNTPIQFLADSVHYLQTASADAQTLLESQHGLVARAATNRPKLLAELAELEEAADLEFMRQEVPRAFERVFEGTKRVTSIVRALKEFAHPDRREKCYADINRAIESTLVVARNEYKYCALVELDLGSIPQVLCHAGDVNQVFLNLVVNAAHAIEAAPKNPGEMGRIRISTRRDGDEVVVEIADTGCGIPKDIADRVFDHFFTTKGVGKGTGQGLAIARSIVVERHGGRISFESEVGRGTTFTIGLPIGKSEEGGGSSTGA